MDAAALQKLPSFNAAWTQVVGEAPPNDATVETLEASLGRKASRVFLLEKSSNIF